MSKNVLLAIHVFAAHPAAPAAAAGGPGEPKQPQDRLPAPVIVLHVALEALAEHSVDGGSLAQRPETGLLQDLLIDGDGEIGHRWTPRVQCSTARASRPRSRGSRPRSRSGSRPRRGGERSRQNRGCRVCVWTHSGHFCARRLPGMLTGEGKDMNLIRHAAAAALTTVFGVSSALGQEPPPAPKPKLKDELRMPWTRGDDDFLRQWLVAGPFAGGLGADRLSGQGGEAARPADRTARS